MDNTISAMLGEIDATLGDYLNPPSGALLHSMTSAHLLVAQYRQLVEALHLRAYPVAADSDDRLEQVVITVHGVDLSIRGRTSGDGDLFVHIDEDDRDQDDRDRFPLVVEVGASGENTYS